MAWRRTLLDLARRTRLLRAVGASYGRGRLTVLAYHRVVDHEVSGFDTMRRNVSATPEAFDGQMRAVAGYFSPVAMQEVVAFVDGGAPLPARPLLVTFDDGYRDNLTEALPILRHYGIPATVFLATDHIGTASPLWWDFAAYCFAHTERQAADLPELGARDWTGERVRDQVLAEWSEHLKGLAHERRQAAVAELPDRLEVNVPAAAFDGLMLSWDEVRSMREDRVDFGAHTRTHPILTRVDPERARREISGSKAAIEAKLGDTVTSFAYPNGQPADVTPEIRAMVQEAGFRVAVTLFPGPARPNEVRRDPLMIRRVFVHHRDHPSRFAAKVMGLVRIGSVVR